MKRADTVPRPAASGLWGIAWRRLQRNRIGLAAAVVVLAFLILIAATASGWLARDWDAQAGISFAPPTWFAGPAGRDDSHVLVPLNPRTPVEMYGVVDPLANEMALLHPQDPPAAPTSVPGVEDPIAERFARALAATRTSAVPARAPTLLLGADKWGRSVALKVIKGAETSVLVGLSAAVLATLIGSVLGALAGYLGGWIDAVLDWLYGVFTAIPYLLLVFAIAAVLQQKGVTTIILILGLTGWTGVYRLIRAEYLKHKVREYVVAARAIGASHPSRMFVHILPNVSHVILVQLSQQVVNFIKAEVILSFLGFGVPVDVVSWGSILNEAPSELILGKWWQMAVAGTAMALLVTAFALLTDALRDALDPRLK
jgi:peptide/nickel transport system permease protein